MKIIKMSHSYVMTTIKSLVTSHTIELYLWYSSYFGDSLTACRLSVYELSENLDTEHAYYTNINPENYYDHADPNSLLGTKAYTAVDLSVKRLYS